MAINFSQPTSIAEAVDSIGKATPIGSVLNSAEWAELPVQVRMRSFWSATVEDARWLDAAQKRILKAVDVGSTLAAGEAVMDRAKFVQEMRRIGLALNLQPTDERAGTLQDITSERRLRLIYDTNMRLAYGHAQNMRAQEQLEVFPAWEFVRKEQREEPRNWRQVWRTAMNALGNQTRAILTDGGRMIAPVNDPIWLEISLPDNVPGGLGTLNPPFAYQSGYGWRSIDVIDWEELSGESEETIATEAKKIEPPDLNDGVESSVAGMEEPTVRELEKALGRRAQREGDKLLMRVPVSDAVRRAQKTAQILQRAGGDARAASQELFLEAEATLEAAGMERDALDYVRETIRTAKTQDATLWERILRQLVYLLDGITGEEDD